MLSFFEKKWHGWATTQVKAPSEANSFSGDFGKKDAVYIACFISLIELISILGIVYYTKKSMF